MHRKNNNDEGVGDFRFKAPSDGDDNNVAAITEDVDRVAISDNNLSAEKQQTCSNCGKEGTNLNICNKCKIVNYCNAACKKKHRKKHKKKCEERVAELHEEALFKDVDPDECSICCLPVLDASELTFKACCGKDICNGCNYAMIAESFGRGKLSICPYCREPRSKSMEEENERIKKCMDSGNADAFTMMGNAYANGDMGMPRDRAKANELYLRAGELGCATAYFNLGNVYRLGAGVEMDMKKAKHFYELSAMKGDVEARQNLGAFEGQAGNNERAYKHYIVAARAGHTPCMDMVKKGFMIGYVTKDEYENTLRAHKKRQDEAKSDARDIANRL